MGNFIDLSGQKFGRLTVVSRAENKGKYVAWNCLCDCGNEELVVVTGNHLKNGHTQSCGCQKKDSASKVGKSRKINLVGDKYNRLTVVKEIGKIGKYYYWDCICTCGNKTIARGSNLRSGQIQSCGCLLDESRKNIVNLVGEKFNMLTVISRAENVGKEVAWNCKCDCGNDTVVIGTNIKSGHTISCGCVVRSKGEIKIAKYLKDNNVDFEEQKRFLDCKDKNTLPFDFYLPLLNVCIEFDGRQHIEPVDFGGNRENVALYNFKKIQQHDKIKNQYCKDNNINLLRIPHTEFDNIEKILLEKLS